MQEYIRKIFKNLITYFNIDSEYISDIYLKYIENNAGHSVIIRVLRFTKSKSEMTSEDFHYLCYLEQICHLMATNDNTQKGYVYILTNQSFREDWIKIGKSSRPVNVRSKELDNTAVPLPFEIYATMKTASYNKVESMLHRILEGTHTRIRKTREFFNVKPEVALDAFYGIAELLSDAEVYLGGNESSEEIGKKIGEIKTKRLRRKPTSVMAGVVEVHPEDDLPLRSRFSLDGEHFYSMSHFCFVFIKQLLADNPSLTYPQLETMLPKKMLQGFTYCGVVARKEVVDSSTYPPAAKMKAYHQGDSNYLLTSNDGVEFYTSTQWTRDSFKSLLAIIESNGYQVFMQKR